MKLELHYTKLANAFLGENKPAFEERLKIELQEEMSAEDLEDSIADNLLMHSFEYDERLYIVYPKNGTLTVDSATFVEYPEPLKAGPFAGKKLMLPQPDSEDE